MNPPEAYAELTNTLRRIGTLDSIGHVLNWDEHTYLPSNGTTHRADQSALLATITHEAVTSPRVGELLNTLEASDLVRDAESDAAANVRECRRNYDRARKLPTRLVEELTRTGVLAQAAWVQARKNSNFPTFQPWLEKLLGLKREEAKCYGYKKNMYDALLDSYEPGECAENVQKLFDSFRQRLTDLVQRIGASGKRAPVEILARSYPVPLQDQLARQAASALGYDFDAGRLDITVHPFCSGIGPGDTRITTRFDEHDFGNAFFSTLHEVGHALYEQGLAKDKYFGQPLGEAISSGIHESQSRLWENFVGRRRSFWRFFYPKLRATFPSVVADVTDDQWLFANNDVRPSFIRTEADETTYNLHIILRFELEQLLLTDQIKVPDLPAAWNQRMKQYLGVTPPDDARGVLQDIHWAFGGFGYFPTYALGNLYAAQFFEQAAKDLGDLDAMFARGEFQPLLGWLRDKIHRHGKRYLAGELVKRITGAPLSADALMRHLESNARNSTAYENPRYLRLTLDISTTPHNIPTSWYCTMPRAANPKTREALLDASESLMLRQGFAASSVDDICRAARLTKGSFFHYFGSKKQVGVEAVKRFYARMRDSVAGADFQRLADPRKRILGYLDFLIRFSRTPDAARGCLIGNLAQELAGTNAPIRAACADCFNNWTQWLRQELAAAPLKTGSRTNASSLADHCVAAIEGAILLAKTRRDPKVLTESLAHLKRYLALLFR